MNERKDYAAPEARFFRMPDEPLMAISARPGTHVYDEGLDTEDGWTDDESYF